MTLVVKPVRLVLKAPSKNVSDHMLNCPASWTVGELKKQVSEFHPKKPAIGDLRLIYSGQLLRDHLELKDILRQYDENAIHTIHLVCAPPKYSVEMGESGKTVASNQVPLEEKRTHVPNVRVMEVQQPVRIQVWTGQATELNLSNYMATCGALPVLPATPDINSTPEQIMQHMYMMHQMYAQFVIQYMNYMQSGIAAPFQVSALAANEEHAINQQVVFDRNNAQDRNVRINGDVIPVANGFVIRDWLDYVYMVLCTSVFFAIIFLFSTPTRILSVILMILVLYICQSNWFRAPLSPSRCKKSESSTVANNKNATNHESHQLRRDVASPEREMHINAENTRTASAVETLDVQTPQLLPSAVSSSEVEDSQQNTVSHQDVLMNNDRSFTSSQPGSTNSHSPFFITISNFIVGFFASLMPL